MARSTRTLMFLLIALVLLATVSITGCQSGTPAVRIGVLPTEDSLPLWVAEKNGYFGQEGISRVEIVEFQSAQERDAAFASGAIDGFMGDIIAAANLTAAGKPNTIVTVMLGADKTQGRFGVATSPGASETALGEFADVPIGTSSATIQEYVLDGLMHEAGVATSAIKVVNVPKVPVRYQLLMAGKIRAAALPEPFLSLAQQGGSKILGDDTMAKTNLSQTVLVFSNAFLKKEGGRTTVAAVLRAWDKAVTEISMSSDPYRELFVEKVKLPKDLVTVYRINTYPTHQLPSKADVDPVLAWMKAKGYLKANVTYEQLVGKAK